MNTKLLSDTIVNVWVRVAMVCAIVSNESIMQGCFKGGSHYDKKKAYKISY